ncbi:hypothetical protein OB2597_15031 [Pseudooceanicola batsensis HTCC2597]|uniref:Activator of Hsp90 ATPase homologue 1/2-like C-terminal domain-containing protein n=1 Tax=Pseudooceanicola batsensis (strain ATCC BAA-863 / DSM 15984 / KCTC 12145 / HTCC2597) TaxID=252305 RepID=A3U2G8_PSEBH|nr:SRPBCC domain-containing protein [Pseudooceanicola batsensis]EAQ01768.1 hypothetical protein OB2597_15031 [Pseudooceanicola batsensis HTCC2597]
MIHAKAVAVARASLPVRRPRRECFLAFTDPEMLTRFWPHSAGDLHLEEGRCLHWCFEDGAETVAVDCKEVRPDCLIRLSLSNGTRIMLTFDRYPEGGTVIHYCQCGFGPDAEAEEVAAASRAAALMLAELKALLEPAGASGQGDARYGLPDAA